MASSLIALGSNLGDSRSTLGRAQQALEEHAELELTAASAIIETPAVGGPADQPRYFNSALLLETTLSPRRLLELTRHIEQQLGRQRDIRWGPRTIDLDVLLYDNLVIRTADLQLPHPRMTFRRFVLDPACQVAEAMRHPLNGATLGQLRQHLLDSANYLAIAGPGSSQLAQQLASRDGCLLAAGDPAMGGAFPDNLQRALAQDPTSWVISDGWVDQLLLPVEGKRETTRWLQHRQSIPPPRIVVVIEPRQLDQRVAWRRVTERPHRLPLLVLPADDLDLQLEETLAAIAAASNVEEPAA